MEGKTDNSQKKEEHDSLKPARDAIATAMRAAQFAKATGTPLPKPLKWQREFYDATGVFPYGWYECPVCGYRTDWHHEAQKDPLSGFLQHTGGYLERGKEDADA